MVSVYLFQKESIYVVNGTWGNWFIFIGTEGMNTCNEGKEFVFPIKLKETGFNSLNWLHALKTFFLFQ